MDATGVPVKLSYVDPNGNYYDIDTVISDTEGFRLDWTPPEIGGVYQIIATFDGTTSYWPSYTTTSLVVEQAPPATPPPEPTPAPMTDTYVLGMGAAAIAAIIVIGLVLILLVRKK
jgi:hypothetical protein